MNKILVLSIALNGYQFIYKDELRSHKQYAIKHGYAYEGINKPLISKLGVECCWLKLTLMKEALLSGYDGILFLDADTFVKDNCPALSTISKDKKLIYMSKGYSGRFNSGVIFIRNDPASIQWLNQIITARHNKVSDESDVGWGENGHVIEYSNGVPFIAELDKRWNNTSDPELNDYITHTNAGPMRIKASIKLFHRVLFFISARRQQLIKISSYFSSSSHNLDYLLDETALIISHYPRLTNTKMITWGE